MNETRAKDPVLDQQITWHILRSCWLRNSFLSKRSLLSARDLYIRLWLIIPWFLRQLRSVYWDTFKELFGWNKTFKQKEKNR